MCDLRLGSLFPSLSIRPSVYLFTCLFCMHLPVPAPSVGETALFPGHYPGAYIPGLFPFCCADQAPILSPVHPANYCGFGYSSFQMLNSLASWDKLRLVLVSYYFYLLQNSICQYLVENFCIRVHERYLSVLSGSCFFSGLDIGVIVASQNALGSVPSLLYGKDDAELTYFFFKCLIEFTGKIIWP